MQVTNDTVRPATRVLLAGQPPRAALSLLPRRTRPAILAVASSDSGTMVETASAYGRRAWRVIVPPVSTVGLAIRVGSADTPPALSAWTEPALSSHNRQLAIFITAVGALIAAAALITGGLAVLIGHAAPRWVALTLLMLLLELAVGHRHVRCQPRHPDRRTLRPVGLPDRAGAGGGRAAGRRHHSGARYSGRATAKQLSPRRLWA